MEDIKVLIKKAKKEEKKNAEFLYQLGLRFKNGEGVNIDMFKADKYFAKSGKLGHIKANIEHALFWWKNIKSYYYAEIYLNKAIKLGSDEAKEILAEMKKEEQEKKANKNKATNDNLIHCSNKKDSNLYETPKFKDDSYTSFVKYHTLICCPACRNNIKMINNAIVGQLTEQVIKIYDKDTCFERKTEPYSRPTREGQVLTQTYKCESCNLIFDKIIHTKYDERDKEETLKEMITMSGGGTEWWRIVKISYNADNTKIGKDVLKILKKFEGKFEGKL